MDQYLVIGNPITHSLSPQIHQTFAEQTGQSLTYERLCVEPESFFQTLDNFFANRGKGANITAPFKLMAYEYVQGRCSKEATLAKAVNTLWLNPQSHQVEGHNTDGIGLLNDLKKNAWTIADKNILILGAGGAVQGILPALLTENPRLIHFYNRTPAKVLPLIKAFQDKQTPSLLAPFVKEAAEHREAGDFSYDIIFNAIPAAQSISVSELQDMGILATHTACYDLSYHLKEDTPFIASMKKLGCQHTKDGFGMLVEQAAESFYIWRGVRPITESFKISPV